MKLKNYLLMLVTVMVAFVACGGHVLAATYTGGTPTVFVHGLQGNYGSTDTMIRDLSHRYSGTRKVMTINVKPNGQLAISGRFQKVKHPLVQVNFLNNSASTTTNAHWLNRALTYLYQKQGVRKINIVAHSAGNVAAYQALAAQASRTPKTKKFVILAGPFDGVLSLNDEANKIKVNAKDHYKPSIMYPANSYYPSYKQLLQLSTSFPKTVQVLNVYGDLGDGSHSDGLVSNASSLSVNYLLRHQKTPVKNKCFQNSKATHSGLHKSKTIDNWIANFLW
ncbi:alpha/beta hydrolase [uncultured Limosilactobacillus sp.]|uniref:alpha/beta hydrolase n=1 Tax=uncultured Limosilactobacillus sp. TaxID=2837629 RepID=UPI0025F602E1|nr:alpha/beta hydrolase [uncultured Limosilactobacillus sp.]